MPSLIDIRRRIRSVKNTQQITKAMKMVSAAKLRRAQDRVIAARPYGAMLRQMLANVAAAAASDPDARRAIRCWPCVPRSASCWSWSRDSGLAGAFNSNLIKAGAALRRRASRTPKLSFELIGRKGRDYFRKRDARHRRRAHRTCSAKLKYRRTPTTIAERDHRAFRERRDRRGLPVQQRIQERDGAER